jgi:hypothetical protein
MAKKAPSVFRDFNLTLQGQGYLGRCNYIEIPKLKKKTEEVRYSGDMSPTKEFMGYESMTTKISFPCFIREVYQMFSIDGKAAVITARGAYKKEGGLAESCVIVIGGKFEEIDPGKWQSGEKNEFVVTVDTRILSITYDGIPAVNIDADNAVYTIGGVVDSNLDVKRAIGAI